MVSLLSTTPWCWVVYCVSGSLIRRWNCVGRLGLRKTDKSSSLPWLESRVARTRNHANDYQCLDVNSKGGGRTAGQAKHRNTTGNSALETTVLQLRGGADDDDGDFNILDVSEKNGESHHTAKHFIAILKNVHSIQSEHRFEGLMGECSSFE